MEGNEVRVISAVLDNLGYDTYGIGDFQLYFINNGCWDNVANLMHLVVVLELVFLAVPQGAEEGMHPDTHELADTHVQAWWEGTS